MNHKNCPPDNLNWLSPGSTGRNSKKEDRGTQKAGGGRDVVSTDRTRRTRPPSVATKTNHKKDGEDGSESWGRDLHPVEATPHHDAKKGGSQRKGSDTREKRAKRSPTEQIETPTKPGQRPRSGRQRKL